MRGLVLASLFLAALAHTEPPAGRARKSLGFGPAHPHAVYKSSPYQIVTNGFTAQDPEACPFGVARTFLDDLLRDQLSESSSYTIRDDSYVDKTSGIAHIYARQVVNGLEVADGDINLNIKDGVVLSYGNSVSSFRSYPTYPKLICLSPAAYSSTREPLPFLSLARPRIPLLILIKSSAIASLQPSIAIMPSYRISTAKSPCHPSSRYTLTTSSVSRLTTAKVSRWSQTLSLRLLPRLMSRTSVTLSCNS